LVAQFYGLTPRARKPERARIDGDWIYEMKFDGYRALAFKAGSEVRLLSRSAESSDARSFPACLISAAGLTHGVKGSSMSARTPLGLYRSFRGYPPE
jgi:hypothetical protein